MEEARCWSMNRTLCQTAIQVKDYLLVIQLFWNICGEGSLRKRIWFGKNNTGLFIPFLLPNCTQDQHLSGCCCLTCLLNYESLRLFIYLVWKFNSVTLVTALHDDDEWYLTRLLRCCACIWPIAIAAPAINTQLSLTMWGTVTCKLLHYTYPWLNFSSSEPILRIPK